jgi:hypothetical protein
MKVKDLINKLKEVNPELDIVIYDDVGKGVRISTNITTPHYVEEKEMITSLSKFPITIANDLTIHQYNKNPKIKYPVKKCLLIS